MTDTSPFGPRRRYRVLDLVGRGGGGSVYRARMESSDGFAKEVALKVVRGDISPEEIGRFRDEARILGLVRDRSLVNVEPPIRLGDRWAMVMEFVDGVSAQRMVSLGALPPRPALEIVAEIGRVLHKVYSQPGPDGNPLHLIHRDIKPANLQLTPDGDVKLLDFGVASARFENREAGTMNNIAGTRGYIAPERLLGIEGPAGDVYSLGVLLHVLVTADRPVELRRRVEERSPDLEPVLELAERMRHPTPAMRPGAGEVEQLCTALAGSIGGPTLRQWAAEAVPSRATFAPDDLVGAMLTETVEVTRPTTPPAFLPASVDAPRRVWLPVIAVIALAIGTLGLALGLGLAVWMLPLNPPGPPPPVEPVPASAPEPVAAPPTQPPAAPEPVAAPPTPAPVAPTPVRPTAPKPTPSRPTAAPVAPAPDPQPAPAPEHPAGVAVMTFDSVPSGALVTLNGVPIGHTPLRGQPVSYGTYELELERDGQSIVRTVRIGGRGSTTYTWQGDQLVAK